MNDRNEIKNDRAAVMAERIAELAHRDRCEHCGAPQSPNGNCEDDCDGSRATFHVEHPDDLGIARNFQRERFYEDSK